MHTLSRIPYGHRRHFRSWLNCLVVAALASVTSDAAQCAEPAGRQRYAAAWEDGSFSWGSEVGPWGETQAQPRLSGRALFGSSAPVRWLLDTQIAPASLASTRVELLGGDHIPGRVIALRSDGDAAGQGLPAHLLVIPTQPVDRAGAPAREGLRVLLRWVRRIVCQPVAASYQPSTLFLRDGRQLAFRSLRVGDNVVRTLTAAGVVETPLSAIAELHMPLANDWDAYYEQVALLCPDAATRLVQVETQSGLVVTASTARFQAETSGKGPDSARWQHILQPAWSPDPLWLPHAQIRLRRYFSPMRVPLARFLPSVVRQRSKFGSSWRWQADRNVEGGPLQSGGRIFQGGFGVHARSELEFVIPPAAEAFRTGLGLDDIAGNGGCVRPSVRLLEPTPKAVYDGPVLVGSETVADTGVLALERPAGSPARLALIVDAVQDSQPAGADPFDIRDHFDWLEPELILSREMLHAQVFQRGPQTVPAWRDWQVTTDGQPGARLASYWDPDAPDGPRYRVAALGALKLTRKIEVSERNEQLLLAVTSPPGSPPCGLEIQVAGRTHHRSGVSLQPDPVRVSLAEFRNQTVEVAVLQVGASPLSGVCWGGIRLVEGGSNPQ